jgi:hypothetical protein
MITGVHALLYSTLLGDVRAFLRDVLQLPSVDEHSVTLGLGPGTP